METILEAPKEVTIVESVKATIAKFSEPKIIYSNEDKTCLAIFYVFSKNEDESFKEEGRKELMLWSGDAYDAIGQWTDTDVKNRIVELL